MADLDDLLLRTSRTYALAIPQLPEPTCREVTIAYLLFRIADTFEDAIHWTPAQQVQTLGAFSSILEADTKLDPAMLQGCWGENPPVDDPDYLDLLAEAPAVLRALEELRPEAQRIIRHHTRRTARGMAEIAGRGRGIELSSLEELEEYCYIVAGIVGEMLTDLFLLERPQLAAAEPVLRENARYFGEGLQLTNILKDSAGDAREGRRFVPREEDRPAVFSLARKDLLRAGEYVRALEAHGAEPGLLAFTAIPVLLAWPTLARVEAHGPGSKITRDEVGRIVQEVHGALEAGTPVLASAPA